MAEVKGAYRIDDIAEDLLHSVKNEFTDEEEVANVQEKIIERKKSIHVDLEIEDSDWVCSCFMVTSDVDWDYEKERRYFTSATRKVGGSGLGDGRVLNMPPGINEFADIPVGFGITGNHDGTGMGVFYSECLDDNLDIIHIRPGVPRYSSLSRFYMNAIQTSAVKTAEYGWFDSMVNGVARAGGYLLTLPFRIVMSPFNLIGRLLSSDDTNRYSYYYLAPATHAYWKTLDNIVNDFAIRSGLIPGAVYDGRMDDGTQSRKTLSDDEVAYFKENLPGVFLDNTLFVPRIDTLAISARHTLLMSRREEYLASQINDISSEVLDSEYQAKWEHIMRTHNPWGDDPTVTSLEGVTKLGENLDSSSQAMSRLYEDVVGSSNAEVYEDQGLETVEDSEGNISTVKNVDIEAEALSERGLVPEMDDSDFTSNFYEVVRGGADFVSLAVNHVGESTISINNQSGPSGVASVFDNLVASAKGVQFSTANGNIGDGAIANGVEGLITSGKAAISGLTESFLGGLPAAMAGGKAFLDFPEVYQSSNMEFNNVSYSLQSVATSGHPLAKLRMLMPYFALLALASPRSAGPSSFTSPFLVELHHKGRACIQLGLIDSLSVTFGEVDAWDINDIPNLLSIDFSVTNLSKGFHVPVDPETSFTYKDTGEFTTHMTVLSGTTLTDRDKSIWYNSKVKAMRLSQKLDRATSATYWAHMTGSITKDLFSGPLALAGLYVNRN